MSQPTAVPPRPHRRRLPAHRAVAALALLVVAWAVLTPTSASAAAAGRPPTTRALWVWEQLPPETVVSAASARGVTDLYVAVTPTVLTDGDLPRLQALARLAQPAGIRLVALGGDPAWTTHPDDAVAWQTAALSTGLFAASHVDVEPYALPGWSRTSARARLVAQYVDLLARLQQADPRPLELDVPFWYDTVASPTRGRTLADDVLAQADAVTVMSYRDTGAGIVSAGRDLLDRSAALAAATGRRVPVHLGAETRPLADCSQCTFAGQGRAALDAALDDVDAATAADPAYAGIAVHDLTGLLALRP